MRSAGIVGMGVMGRVLALMLHQEGWQVSLFDENDGDSNCSFAAAGLLCPLSELDRADALIYQLGLASIDAWPRLIKALSSNIYFKQLGSLVVHHPADAAEWLHFRQRIDGRGGSVIASAAKQSSGLTQSRKATGLLRCARNDGPIQLTSNELQTLEPELSKFDASYYFPTEAQIDSQSVMSALKSHFTDLKLPIRIHTKVLSIEPHQIKTAEQSFHYDMVFDCRGLGAKDVFKDLRGIRGELLWLHAPEVHIKRPLRLLHPRYSLYIVPRPEQVYLIGASEIEAEDLSPISVQTTLELLSAVYFVHSGFAEARIIKNISQNRPTLANHLPRIRYQEGLMAVNGLYRHGFLLAPALAQDMLRAVDSNFQDIHYPNLWEPSHAKHYFQ